MFNLEALYSTDNGKKTEAAQAPGGSFEKPKGNVLKERDRIDALEREGHKEDVILAEANLKIERDKDDAEIQALYRAGAEANLLVPKPDDTSVLVWAKTFGVLKRKYADLYAKDPGEMRKFRDMSPSDRQKYFADLAKTKEAEWKAAGKTDELPARIISAQLRAVGFMHPAEQVAYLKSAEGKAMDVNGALAFVEKEAVKFRSPAIAQSATASAAPETPTTATDAAIAKLPDFVKDHPILLALAVLFIGFAKGGDGKTIFEKVASVFSGKKEKKEKETTQVAEAAPTKDHWSEAVAQLTSGGVAQDTAYNNKIKTPLDDTGKASFDRSFVYLRSLGTKEGALAKLNGPYAYRRGDETVIGKFINTNAETIDNHRQIAKLATEYEATPAGVAQPNHRGFIEWLGQRQVA